MYKNTRRDSILDHQPYDECDTKTHQHETVDAVEQVNIAGGKPCADLIGQHYFCNVRAQNNEQRCYKNNNAFVNGMGNEGGGRRKPENKNAGIERVQKKSGKEQLEVIAFAENRWCSFDAVTDPDLFKESIINTQHNKESAANDTDGHFLRTEAGKELRKEITDKGQGSIAGGNTEHKGQPAPVSYVNAVLDD